MRPRLRLSVAAESRPIAAAMRDQTSGAPLDPKRTIGRSEDPSRSFPGAPFEMSLVLMALNDAVAKLQGQHSLMYVCVAEVR